MSTRRRAVVLAAGHGTRMRSTTPKVLHRVCGRSMLWHILLALRASDLDEIAVVISPTLAESEALTGLVSDVLAQEGSGSIHTVVQERPLGTAHAVGVGLSSFVASEDGHILVVSGDMPLLESETLRRVLATLDATTPLALVTAAMGRASSFGRIVRTSTGEVERIVEVRDADPAELALDEMNAGVYGFDETTLRLFLPQIEKTNAQGEYYLTDMVGLLRRNNRRVVPLSVDDVGSLLGVNDRIELAAAERAMNARLAAYWMRRGVTIIDPAATYLEPGVEIGKDTTIEPGTILRGRTTIGEGAHIGPATRLIDAQVGARSVVCESVIVESIIGDDCRIGPFAHVRMRTILGDDVRLGNFVETKQSRIATGVRAGHLSYLGDADIGEATNIGAGTITCNYDGQRKHRTRIGRRVFIGSNTSLIAPLEIGDGALTGAGAVVTRDVAPGDRVVGNPARPLERR